MLSSKGGLIVVPVSHFEKYMYWWYVRDEYFNAINKWDFYLIFLGVIIMLVGCFSFRLFMYIYFIHTTGVLSFMNWISSVIRKVVVTVKHNHFYDKMCF